MERSIALDKYVEVVNTSSRLAEKRLAIVGELNKIDQEMDEVGRQVNDLREIILAKIIPPQRTNPYPLNNVAKRIDISGPTQLAIIKVLREADSGLNSHELANRAGMGWNAIGCALTKLVSWGVINREGSNKMHYKYSLAVHPDPSREEQQ